MKTSDIGKQQAMIEMPAKRVLELADQCLARIHSRREAAGRKADARKAELLQWARTKRSIPFFWKPRYPAAMTDEQVWDKICTWDIYHSPFDEEWGKHNIDRRFFGEEQEIDLNVLRRMALENIDGSVWINNAGASILAL